jgi:hypothetical protein
MIYYALENSMLQICFRYFFKHAKRINFECLHLLKHHRFDFTFATRRRIASSSENY